ncbi:MAG: aminotransferase class III-fold pyridoxal phosphate-dependent enzyme, partial [Candidatus Korarchaeum sp.]|nr:aminotransferase class III-fold pyridoxal phosphate-dependent enzyme [Candidatus Korarchaeum sp.]
AATSLGQCHPKVVNAIKSGVEKITGFSGLLAPTEPFLRLGKELSSITPIGDPSIAYATTGSEASDFAIQLAKYATERSVVISFYGAYHGLTGYALFSSPTEGMRKVKPHLVDALFAPYPNCSQRRSREGRSSCVEESIEFIEEEIIGRAVEPDDVAAIIVEPLQSHGGIILPPPEFFKELRRLANEVEAILIVDEVYTGFGRTGRWWGIEHHGVEPDVIVMGKGIAGGLPLAAVAFRSDLIDEWYLCSGGSLGTFAGNYLSALASLATIEAIREEDLLRNAEERGRQLSEALEEFVEKFDVVEEARGIGCVQGIEIFEGKRPSRKLAEELKWALFRRGLLAIPVGRYHNVIKLTPPITISEEQMEEAIRILEKAIQEVSRR